MTFTSIEFIADQFAEVAAPTIKAETAEVAKTRTPKSSDKICQDMKNLALAMAKPKSKHPMSGDEAADVLAAMEAIRELFGFEENTGAKSHVTRCVNLVLDGKVSRTEFNELIKHFDEVVVPAAIEAQQLKEVAAMEAAA